MAPITVTALLQVDFDMIMAIRNHYFNLPHTNENDHLEKSLITYFFTGTRHSLTG